jgi:heme/copper-type cytochrome/quinol oxidase subunit 2
MSKHFRWLAMILVAFVAACASRGGTGEGSTTVQVENNVIPSTLVTVWAVPEIGTRVRLGDVLPGQTKALSFNATVAGQYRLLARTTSGAELVSNPIFIGSGDTLVWDMSANIVAPGD